MIEIVYDLIHVIPLCFIFVLSVITGAGEENGVLIYFLAIAFGALPVVYLHIKSRSRTIMTGIIITAIVGIMITMGEETRSSFIHEFKWVLWVMLIGIGCLLAEKIADRYRKIKFVFLVAGVVALLVFLFRQIIVSKCVVLMFFLYAIVTLLEEIQLSWNKEGDTKLKPHVVYVFPFVAVLFLLMFLVKTPDKPYDWGFVKSFAKAARIRYEIIVQSLDIRKSWDSDEAKIGFSDNGGISGEITSDPYRVFNISRNTMSKGTLYLAGKSFDSFDGRRWIKNDVSLIDYKMYDVLETLGAVIGHDPASIADYLKNDYIYINCVGVRTKHAFTPEKSLSVIDDAETEQVGGDVSFSRRKKLLYKVRYFRINRSFEGFEELVNEDRVFDKEALESAKAELTSEDMSEFTIEGYNRYREHIYDVYASSPNLSERAMRELDRVLEGADTDYEKLKCIEEYLLEFKYTTDPGELPEYIRSGAEFVDYLIFDKKSGYCTHFATAFVLMARAQGIPARYMQGYDCITTGKEDEVMSDRAHAWAEAYIDGFGWLDFEPTPGFKKSSGWVVSDKSVGDKTDYYSAKYKNGTIDHEMNDMSDLSDDTKDKRSFDLKVFYMPLVMVAAFIVVFLIFDMLYKNIRYSRMSQREKVMTMWEKNLKLLKRIGLKMRDGETLTEFENRAKESITYDLVSYIGVFEKIIYADKQLEPEDTALFENCNVLLKRYVFRQMIKRRHK
ncbi:MAG: transglutaminase-like domain-containing protein [Lachnospiraceae bacterium]|nr:transglutaminase-like domain-containing protein [Lachnospiraceae bacterium]